MKTLVIVDLTLIDKAIIAQYSQLAAKTLETYGGQFIAKGPIESLHGDAPYGMKAVIEFPDKQSARDWYSSDAYQAIIPLRNTGMDSQFHLV
ncbi:DUF1330 domain-containing protein [Paraglaciecola marina]|uniref:DUF1330 domain-containing protein n=1 Tax=Paraglaciecola marina TaxID=2500157 RepID=UPI001061ED86|nr:DUF1330 domain-containing protein [Paraglaciecola marina]